MFDVVVVGGGLAGLAAASRLSSLRVLVLEREKICGGRVLTRQQQGVPYDLGAVFSGRGGPVADVAPVETLVPSGVGVGLHALGQWFRDDTVMGCLRKTLAGVAGGERLLADFRAGRIQASQLSPAARDAVRAFFHVIHPGALDESMPRRRLDALQTYSEGFRAAGNGDVVDVLHRLAGAQVVTDTEVRSVVDEGGWVRIECRTGGRSRSVRGRVAIVATPPLVARAIVRHVDSRVEAFLRAVDFLPGMSCVAAVSSTDVDEFNYLVAADLPFNTVIQCRRPTAGCALLHTYYLGDRLQAVFSDAGMDPGERAFRHLLDAGIVRAGSTARFVDSHCWDGVGPRISSSVYGTGEALYRASPRVTVAGDYTWFDPDHQLPFGMGAAIASGHRAAVAALEALGGRRDG